MDELLTDIAALIGGPSSKVVAIAQAAAAELGGQDIDALVARLHDPPPLPERLSATFRRPSAWIDAWQGAVFEVLVGLGELALPTLRRMAHGPYDWTQARAVEVLARLGARGVDEEAVGQELAALLPTLGAEALASASSLLRRHGKDDEALDAFLGRYASFERFELRVLPGKPLELASTGLERGKPFERKARTLAEATRAVEFVLPDDEAGRIESLYRWWQGRATGKTETPPPELAIAFVPAFCRDLEALHAAETTPPPGSGPKVDAYAASDRHADHEKALAWMALARMALALPLPVDDRDRVLALATPLARQSNEHKKLTKLPR